MGTVIFDLDGTLVDSAADLIAAANAALAQLGHAPQLSAGADDAVAFRGGRAMLRLAFERLAVTAADAEAGIAAGYPLLLSAYGAALDVHTRPYPGAVAAVEAVRARGHATGICTNKPEAMAEALLQRLGLRDLFGGLVGAGTLPVSKPDPLPYREAVARSGAGPSILVGDTETDRRTATAAGVPCILVGFGPLGDGVAALEPDAVIAHFDALPDAVDRLIGRPD
ncbi:HAD-IA family hydrolase [Rhodobacterales bacterium HKCCE2091]|nr:HAD-IA family hydrolase [Rhodobacterales bacterium HKCCE2091]